MYAQETLYIPQYEEIYKDVIQRYQTDSREFGQDSYRYKEESGRISDKPQVVVGVSFWNFRFISHRSFESAEKSKRTMRLFGCWRA